MWLNASTRPIGNVHLDRAGVVTLGAAGATNTNGRGIADWQCSKGTIPISPTTMGNRMAFAIEAANNGVGETWPRAQMDTYMRLIAMLCEKLHLDPQRDVTTHRGWAGTRKSDPFGPASGYPNLGTQTWSIPALRDYVAAVHTSPPPPPPPSGGTYTVVAGDGWYSIARKLGCTVNELLAANPPATINTVLHPGDVLNVPAGGIAPSPTTAKIGVLDMIPCARSSDGTVWYTLDFEKRKAASADKMRSIVAAGAVDVTDGVKVTDAGQVGMLSDAALDARLGVK
jgi:LysM repeat protein